LHYSEELASQLLGGVQDMKESTTYRAILREGHVSVSVGAREEDWSNSPEAVADWLAWYDSLEPLEFTPAEQADLAEWRQEVKEYTIANMHRGIEGLME
jgi:hypothetical protein